MKNKPPAQPKWISAKNPPTEGGEYIVAATTYSDVIIKSWDIFTDGTGWCGEGNDFKEILFYMPFDSLPELPKEET